MQGGLFAPDCGLGKTTMCLHHVYYENIVQKSAIESMQKASESNDDPLEEADANNPEPPTDDQLYYPSMTVCPAGSLIGWLEDNAKWGSPCKPMAWYGAKTSLPVKYHKILLDDSVDAVNEWYDSLDKTDPEVR